MTDILQMTIADFVSQTAAKQPTPGGGSVTALCGALSASLAAMALRYTTGKKSFAAHETAIQSAITELTTASSLFQELIAEDISAYDALSAMLKLSQEARVAHPDYTATVVAAIRAPQTAAGLASALLDRFATLLDKTNKFLLSDLGIAAVLAHATVHSSELNVRVNLPLLPNPDEAKTLRQNLHDLTVKADKTYDQIRGFMLKML
jgi:formiminotetrahydrofolate cyclodeaminase